METINGFPVNAVFITKNKQERTISISISVDSYENLGKEIRITSKELKKFLEENKNLKLGECLESMVLTNSKIKEEYKLLGNWKFEDVSSPKKEKTKEQKENDKE